MNAILLKQGKGWGATCGCDRATLEGNGCERVGVGGGLELQSYRVISREKSGKVRVQVVGGGEREQFKVAGRGRSVAEILKENVGW